MRVRACVWTGCLASICLVGCMSPRVGPMLPAVPDPSLAPGGTCNDAAARFLLGKTVDERIADAARVRAGARLVRVLRPELPHDDEVRASRLSIEVDNLGRALSVSCR